MRDRLTVNGHIVLSRWLDTMWRETDEHGSSAAPPQYREEYATKDLEDVAACELFVSFTEPPRSSTRGGRHVEYGAALALKKLIAVVGHRENLFHHHPRVVFHSNTEELMLSLKKIAEEA